MQIRKQFTFEAAHVLPHHDGKCARLHGHSYRLDVAVEGPIQTTGPATGMIVDFAEVSRVVKERAIAELDHRSLNEFMPNPTCEEIVLWIWRTLAPEMPMLAELVLWETPTACAVLRRDDPLIGDALHALDAAEAALEAGPVVLDADAVRRAELLEPLVLEAVPEPASPGAGERPTP